MKKVILVAAMVMVGLTSCKKEEVQPKEEPIVEDCSCGTVIQIVDTGMTMGNGWGTKWTDYKIKNNCTGMIDKRTHSSNSSTYPTPNVMDVICN